MSEEDAVLKIAGVILAAGKSERFGQPKQLLDWQGEPFVMSVARHALEGGLSPLLIVTGADHRLVEAAVSELPLKTVYNPRWAEGQSTSMQAGLRALPDDIQAVMFLLSDQPHIPSELIRQLIESYTEHRAPITAPMVGSRRGNPVLFGRETFSALNNVTGDRGGRAILDQFDVDWLICEDERILLDVDSLADLEELRRAYSPEA